MFHVSFVTSMITRPLAIGLARHDGSVPESCRRRGDRTRLASRKSPGTQRGRASRFRRRIKEGQAQSTEWNLTSALPGFYRLEPPRASEKLAGPKVVISSRSIEGRYRSAPKTRAEPEHRALGLGGKLWIADGFAQTYSERSI